MDVEKEIISQFDLLKQNTVDKLQDVIAERDQIKSEVEELRKSCATLYDNLTNKQTENERLKKLNEELEIQNIQLQSQLHESEAQRLKLEEKLNNISLAMKQTESQKVNEEQTCLERFDSALEDALIKTETRSKDVRDDEKEDIESMKDIYISTQFHNTQEYVVPENNNACVKMNLSSDCNNILEKMWSTLPQRSKKKRQENEITTVPVNSNINETKPRLIIPETVDDDNNIIDSELEKTPDRKLPQNMDMSPVLRSTSGRKRKGSFSSDGNEINSSIAQSPIRLVPTRVLLKPIQEKSNLSSPVKRPSSALVNLFTPEKPKTPKRTKKSPRQKTPKKSPARPSQLKRSNLIEVEWTQNGYKKMKQSKLNFGSVRSQKVNEKENENTETENENKEKENENESKKKENSLDKDDDIFVQLVNESNEKILEAEKAVNTIYDEVIFESPKRSQKISSLDFPRKSSSLAVAGSSKDVPAPLSQSLLSLDPEATYVSNSFMRNWEMKNPNLDEIVEEQMPKKIDLSPTEKIPPSHSPPFAYKREAVRKKSERMKLPGHYCDHCYKWYKSNYGDDISPEELQKIMDKCSRHRDKHPDLNYTPPGYWKPYMTMTSSEFEKSDY